MTTLGPKYIRYSYMDPFGAGLGFEILFRAYDINSRMEGL